MKKEKSWIVFMSIIFCACMSSSHPKDLSNVPLPPGLELFKTDSIIDIGDLDGDGGIDRFAYCTKDGDALGFVVGLSSQGNYVFCEWEEASYNKDETNYEYSIKGSDILLDIESRYIRASLVLTYSPELKNMVFKEYKSIHRTTDHLVYGEATLSLKGNTYTCIYEGESRTLAQTALPIGEKSPFFNLCSTH